MQIPGQSPKVGCNVGRQEPGRSGGVGGAILASSRVRRLVGVDFSHSRTMSSGDACCQRPVACCASKPARVIGRQPQRNLLRVGYTSINSPPRSHQCSACRCRPRYGRTSLQIERRRIRGKKDVCRTTIQMVMTIIDYNTSNISATFAGVEMSPLGRPFAPMLMIPLCINVRIPSNFRYNARHAQSRDSVYKK
jgi:hypothetical protein